MIQPNAREAILARLLTVVTAVEGIIYTKRNDLSVSEKNLPAAIILDGDMEVDPTQQIRGGRAGAPIKARLKPEIVIGVQSKPETCGQLLSEFHDKILPKVTRDDELLALLGNNGGIVYMGYTTDLALGRAMMARMGMHFGFDYFILPSRL